MELISRDTRKLKYPPVSIPGLKLDFDYNLNNRKPKISWKANNFLLNDHWVKEEIKKEIKDFVEFNDHEGTTYPNMLHNESTAKRKTHRTRVLHKVETSHNSNLIAHLKTLE